MTLDGGSSSVTASVVVNNTFTIPKQVSYSCSGTTLYPPGYEEWTCLDDGQWDHTGTEIKCLASKLTKTSLCDNENV